MRILSIETSCDDTGIAILEFEKGGKPKLAADLISSQIKIHARFGGVVPTIAKREHQKNIIPLLEQSLKQARLLKQKNLFSRFKKDSKEETLKNILSREKSLEKSFIKFNRKYKAPEIDYISITVGPGLEPALWVGVNIAKAVSFAWDKPIIPINHIEGHMIANFLNSAKEAGKSPLAATGIFPSICLVVSGGHTQIILIKDFGSYEVLGETRDDAAGEAFDKVAKMLGLGYPGGPIISREAEKYNPAENKISLPRPMINSGDFDFSFSGLKTAVLYTLQKIDKKQIKKLTPAISAEFQNAVVDVLAAKTFKAAKDFRAKSVMISGGVAANKKLRDRFAAEVEKIPGTKLLLPKTRFCTDNAAMIALAGYFHLERNLPTSGWEEISAQANLRI